MKCRVTGINPVLPGKEYVPDGEPHVFGDRLYLFGSHDRFNGTGYCQEPYVGWSAPLCDLADWKCEGVILEKGQDPLDQNGDKAYYAPDVAQGPDGKYYLYYSIEESNVISVAVCDEPAGHYHFLDHVHDENGHILGSKESDSAQFDPAVLVEGEKIYLYSGQDFPVPGFDAGRAKGALVCQLAKDMVTAITPQKVITSATENCFSQNPFFEASSIRKFGDTYYFIYSALPNTHTLCYATSEYPDKDFQYKGILISNADISAENPETMNYWGNNHGSLVCINDKYYVFYHRQTNKSGWCRQACAEQISMKSDGSFEQCAMTTSGLRGGIEANEGVIPCSSACHLKKKELAAFQPFQFIEFDENDPFYTQEQNTEIPYIANMRNQSLADYRYIHFEKNEYTISLTYRGKANGKIIVSSLLTGKILSDINIYPTSEWTEVKSDVQVMEEVDGIRFTYVGEGAVDLLEFQFE